MTNYLIHSRNIDSDFTSLYMAMYMEREWGVEVGWNTVPNHEINMKKALLDYQQLAATDCHDGLANASKGSIEYTCCQQGSTLIQNNPTQTDCCPAGTTFNGTTGLCEGAIPTPPVPDCICYTISTVNKWYTYDILLCNGSTFSTTVLPGSPLQICALATPVITAIEPGSGGSSEGRVKGTNCFTDSVNYTCTAGTIVTTTSEPGDCPCCPVGYTYCSSTNKCVTNNSCIGGVDPIPCEPYCADAFGVVTGFVACPDKVPDSLIITYPGLGDGLCCETIVTPWDVNDCNDDHRLPWNRHLG